MSAENKGEKFQESIVINSDYLSLQNVIFGLYTGQKTINYDTSKLLKLLRLSVNQTSSILLLGCLNPNEANFEESLNTLSFVYRCKNYEELTKDETLPSKEIETQVKESFFFLKSLDKKCREKIWKIDACVADARSG